MSKLISSIGFILFLIGMGGMAGGIELGTGFIKSLLIFLIGVFILFVGNKCEEVFY